MVEGPGAVAWRYHEHTKHTPESVRARTGSIDPRRRPHPFKDYAELEPLPLPAELPEYGVPALEALAGQGKSDSPPLGLPELGRLLRWGAGVLRTRELAPGDTYHFRAYSSAGGLYPLEIYAACAELAGLRTGLYHFHPLELALRRLRADDVRALLADAAGATELERAGVVLVVTGLLARSAWKYGPRAYRHLYWDAGTMLAGMLALATSAGLHPRLLSGFVDEQVSRLLRVDGTQEAPLALLAIGQARKAAPTAGPEPPTAGAMTPQAEQSLAESFELHRASRLNSAAGVRSWRAAAQAAVAPEGGASAPPPESPGDPLEQVIRRRGSARVFSLEAVTARELGAILVVATAPLPADFTSLTEIRLLANAVEGLEPGAYRFASGRFEPLGRGDFRRVAGYLCLEQMLGMRAAATNFLLADLASVLARLGDRGYRAAQLDAGLRAGRIYLAAYAHCLGATALTYYDDEVSTFLAPGLSPMLSVAVGIDPSRADLGRRRRARAGRA
jgi:SagB-type dehydrogenase family enzyme